MLRDFGAGDDTELWALACSTQGLDPALRRISLRARLMVGRQSLELEAEVRPLGPQLGRR